MERIRLGIRLKFALLFVVMTVLLIGSIGYSAYTLSFNQVKRQYEALAENSVGMAASLIPGDNLKTYLRDGETQEYQAVYKDLQSLKISYGLKYLYVFVPSADENNAVYVFDIYKDGDDPDLVASLGDESGPIDVYDLVYRIYSTGQTDGSTVVTSGEFGYLASAYTLVRASDGTPAAIVGADIEMNVIIREVWSHTLQILLMAVVIVLVSMAVALLVINRQIILPIRGLSLYMGRFASDKRNLNTERFTVRTGDEIELMADSFNRMAEDVKSYTEHLAAVTADRERIATELQVATQIQASMLPSIFPPFPDRKEFDIYARMEPAKEVGGDFYDFFMIDDRRLGVVIADVSGKGVPAALFMVITKTLIKNQAGFSQTPAEILRLVNNKLLETNDAGFFVTVFMGILEVDNGRFTYSNAGHNLPLLSRAGGQYEFLQADSGFVLAGWEDFDYQTEAVTLNEGDRLVLYTDGVTEALNPREELFGDDRLLETVNRPEAARMPLEALVQLVRDEVERFADGAQQADDITLMALSFGNRQQ